jgi:hypothetical protein
MAYQVNFDPELFMTAGVKADQQRIAPFKQGFSKLSSALTGVVDRMREKEAQRLFEEDVRNRAQWKKLKDQLANPEYEEYEEEVKVPIEPKDIKVPEVPTPALGAQDTSASPSPASALPGSRGPIDLLPESGEALASLAAAKQAHKPPQFRVEKVKKTRQKKVDLPANWEEMDARYSRPLSEQFEEMAYQYRLLSPTASAAMQRRAEQERQIEAQLARDAAQSGLRIREQGGMPELLPLKAQQGELLKQINHYDSMLKEPMAMEFRDQYVSAKQEAEAALAKVNAEIMAKMGIQPEAVSEEQAEGAKSADRSAQLALFDIRNATSREEIENILKNLPEGTSAALKSVLRKEADARIGTLRKLSVDDVKAMKEEVETVEKYFKGIDTAAPKVRQQATEAQRVFGKFSKAPKSFGEAKQNLEAAARVLAQRIEEETGKSLNVEGVLTGLLKLNLGAGEITADTYNTAMQTMAEQLTGLIQGHNANVTKALTAIVGTDEAPISNPGMMNDVARNYAGKLTVGVPSLTFGRYEGGPLIEGGALSKKPKPQKGSFDDEVDNA